jgi:hypothetical protein
VKSILVLWYGWVLVGDYDQKAKTLKGAKVIRRWGTDHGLGELANGPKKETVCDDLGFVAIPQKPLIVIPVKGW